MDDFIGSEECPNLGYLASAMGMFDRFEHEIGAFKWLEYRIEPTLVETLLKSFPDANSIDGAALIFDGKEREILACNALELAVPLQIMEQFWDRFLMIIIDSNTLVLK